MAREQQADGALTGAALDLVGGFDGLGTAVFDLPDVTAVHVRTSFPMDLVGWPGNSRL